MKQELARKIANEGDLHYTHETMRCQCGCGGYIAGIQKTKYPDLAQFYYIHEGLFYDFHCVGKVL